jgi:hypothetical protein
MKTFNYQEVCIKAFGIVCFIAALGYLLVYMHVNNNKIVTN